MAYYVSIGCDIYTPMGHSPDVDFITDDESRLIKVQVKTSGFRDNDRWSVAICTRGGNQSWNKIVKRFSTERCDELLAGTVDGRRWRIPAEAVEATTAVRLGGPKYAEFEVESGPPLTVLRHRDSLRSSTPAG